MIWLLIICAALLCGTIGYVTGRHDRLPRRERRQLKRQDELINNLTVMCITYAPSEAFASIILDEINKTRKEL
jgi:hypothetical protein